jgi:hypothetical protein
MKKLAFALIIIAVIIIGYRTYVYFERKSVIDSRNPKETTVLDDVKGIIGIEKETEKPQYSSEQIRVFVPKKENAPKKTYTNEDIKKLDSKKFKLKKFITEKDLEKYKEKPEKSDPK